MKTRAEHIRRLEDVERIYLRQADGHDPEVIGRLIADVRRRLAVLRRKQARDEVKP